MAPLVHPFRDCENPLPWGNRVAVLAVFLPWLLVLHADFSLAMFFWCSKCGRRIFFKKSICCEITHTTLLVLFFAKKAPEGALVSRFPMCRSKRLWLLGCSAPTRHQLSCVPCSVRFACMGMKAYLQSTRSRAYDRLLTLPCDFHSLQDYLSSKLPVLSSAA